VFERQHSFFSFTLVPIVCTRYCTFAARKKGY